MKGRRTVTMVGGPADGRTYTYYEPLPETLVIQGLFNNQYMVCDYRRRPGTLTYHANGQEPSA